MKYLQVKNFEKFQHYKERNPPWIKIHRSIFEDYEFSCLQDASKLHLLLIWVLASQCDNKIPDDADWIKKKIGVNAKVDLNTLINKGFLLRLQDASKCVQDASTLHTNADSETEAETETETDFVQIDFDLAFDGFWESYPNPVGKQAAKKHFLKSVKCKDDIFLFATALKNYKAHVQRERARGFNLQFQGGSRWFNPNEWKSWVEVETAPAEQRPTGEMGVCV